MSLRFKQFIAVSLVHVNHALALLWVENTLFDVCLLQNIDIHMVENVLQFGGDLHFIND